MQIVSCFPRFFVLLFVCLTGGIVFKKYKMGVESMPEMVPNYEFWASVPSLVKVRCSVRCVLTTVISHKLGHGYLERLETSCK